jgi:hypothetical protein
VANSTIKYEAEKSVLGLAVGGELDLSVADDHQLATAFRDALETRFPPR